MVFLHLHLSLKRGGHWGTTDDFTVSFLHFSLFSTALWDLANSRPFHSMWLFSHIFFFLLFFCLPCLLPLFSVVCPCRMVLARPDKWETCPNHFNLRLFTMARRSSYQVLAHVSNLGLFLSFVLKGLPSLESGFAERSGFVGKGLTFCARKLIPATDEFAILLL